MAENSSGSGATPWLAFLVGGLLVVVAVIAYFVYSGRQTPAKSLDVKIEAPSLPSAPAAPVAPPPAPSVN